MFLLGGIVIGAVVVLFFTPRIRVIERWSSGGEDGDVVGIAPAPALDHRSPVQLSEPTAQGVMFTAEPPTAAGQILTVRLVVCKRHPKGSRWKYQWVFHVDNPGGSDYDGTITVVLLRKDGSQGEYMDFPAEVPSGQAREMHAFDTMEGPMQDGGVITEFGWESNP